MSQPLHKFSVVNGDHGGHIRAVSLFADICDNEEALHELDDIMKEKVYPTGMDLIQEGTVGSELFILISGRAAVLKKTPLGDEYKVAIVDGKENPFFGEGSLIDTETRTATIRTETECHCLILTREDFEKFSRKYPQWALPVYKRIASVVLGRLRKSNTDLMLLYHALVAEIRGH